MNIFNIFKFKNDILKLVNINKNTFNNFQLVTKQKVVFFFFVVIIQNIHSQDNSQLTTAYAKLKDTYINLSNNAVPFKENGKWGLKSFDGEIIYKATLDSIFSLTTKNSLTQMCFLAKEQNLYKLIDYNGNVLFNKSFYKINKTSTYDRKNLYLCDSLHSYHIKIKLNQIILEYFDKSHYSNKMRELNITPKFVDYHFFFDVAKNSTGYLIYDTITKTHLLTCYSSNTKTFEYEIASLKEVHLTNDTILNYRTNNKFISYFISTNKFYESIDSYTIIPTKTKNREYLISKKNSIEFINEIGELVTKLDGEYKLTYQIENDNDKVIFSITKNNKVFYKILNCETHIFYNQDFEIVQNFKDFYVSTDSTRLNIVYNANLKEILRDTNAIFFNFTPNNEISVLISKKDNNWFCYDTLGKLIGGFYSITANELIQEKEVVKIGSYRYAEALGIYINGRMFFMRGVNDVFTLNSNRFLLDKNNEDVLIDSTGKVLLKLPYLEGVITGDNFILETSQIGEEYFQIDSTLQKNISNNFFLGMQDLTKRPVESPYILFHNNTAKNKYGALDERKNIYGLMDQNKKIIQPPTFRIIIAVNKNFIVVDENYNIGYLDHYGTKLY